MPILRFIRSLVSGKAPVEAKPPTRKSRPSRRRKSRKGPPPVAPTKAETAHLPLFPGLPLERIVVPSTPEDFAAAAREIFAAGVAGFDTESKPTFRAGEKSTGPHVVQFALPDKAFIFQLHHAAARPVLIELLQSDRVAKVGFGLQSDHAHIQRKFGIRPQNVIDLDHAFRRKGYRGQIGVRGAVGVLFQQRFPKSKSATTSNWAQPRLTATQLLYAANDAYAALKIHEALEAAK
jgi:ribonuclease D